MESQVCVDYLDLKFKKNLNKMKCPKTKQNLQTNFSNKTEKMMINQKMNRNLLKIIFSIITIKNQTKIFSSRIILESRKIKKRRNLVQLMTFEQMNFLFTIVQNRILFKTNLKIKIIFNKNLNLQRIKVKLIKTFFNQLEINNNNLKTNKFNF